MDGMLTIGRLASVTQVPAATIRYYESVGLVPLPVRSDAGYRLYPRTEVRRLQLIKRGKLLGLSLAQIKELVDQTFTDTCAHLQQALLACIPAQLAAIDQQVSELQALREDLVALQDHLRALDVALLIRPVTECERCLCMGSTKSTERR